MTRNEFIKLLKDNLKPNAQIDFLLSGELNNGKFITAFLDVKNVCMNIDVDDPYNKNHGGIVFEIKDELIYTD